MSRPEASFAARRRRCGQCKTPRMCEVQRSYWVMHHSLRRRSIT